MSGSPAPRKNVFDDPAYEEQTLTQSPTTLAQRFYLNSIGDQYRGTIGGAASLAMKKSIDPETGLVDVEAMRVRDELVQYDNMGSSETLLEYLAAGAGSIYGGFKSPESFVAAPVKWGTWLFKGAAPVVGRIADAAIGNALVNTAIDVPVQALNIASGQQDEYSLTQTSLAPLAGVVFGGVIHGGVEAGRSLLKVSPEVRPPAESVPAEATAPDAATPDPATPTQEPDSALPADVATVPEDAATIADAAQTPAEAPKAAEAVAPEVAAEPAPAAPVVEVDRTRWADDGDVVADYTRATAEAIEGKAEMPDLLAVERVGAPSKPEAPKTDAPASELDFITGQQKALATRTTMRGEVMAAPGKRMAKGQPPESIRARRAILGDLVASFDATVRQGVSGKGTKDALGTFNRKTGVVRTRNLDDASVVAHELGHDLHMRVIGKPLDDLVTKHANELKFLDYDPTKMRPHEGFAEWLRIWATNPNAAAKPAPQFTREVFELLDKNYPRFAKALRSYQADMQAYINAPSAVRAAVDVAEYAKPTEWEKLVKNVKTKGLAQTFGGYFNSFYKVAVDQNTFLRLGSRELLRIAQDNHFKQTGQKITFDFKAADDPYKLKRELNDVKSIGMMDLLHGVRAYGETKASTPPLSEGLAVATGQPTLLGKWDEARIRDLDAYLIALRGKWLYEERFAKGVIDRPPTAATLGDHIATIKDFEAKYPGFKRGAKLVHEWARGMLKKRFDAGLITPTQYAEALAEPFYVPFQRDLTNLLGEDLNVGGGNGGNSLERSSVNRLKGSDRPIVSPIQSLMQQAFRVNMAIRQNDVIRALDRLATLAGPGSAAIAERIPNSRLKAMNVDPIDALRDAAKKQGLSDVDIADLVDDVQMALGEDAQSALFSNQAIKAGGKPIVFFWDGGERKALQLADGDFGREMYHAIMGMPPALGDIYTGLLSAPSTVFRIGITTNPSFLAANFIRDQMSAWVLTDSYIPFWDGFAGMASELRQGDAAKLYNTAGGTSGGAMTAETQSAVVRADINALTAKGWAIQRGTSLNGLFSVAELSETGTRLAIFKKAYKSAKKQGLSDNEAMIEAAHTSRDYIDFGRRGSRMAASARLVPFMNAMIQGLDKTIRTTLAPFARYLRGDVLTKQEQSEIGRAARAWAKIGALAVFSMGLAAINAEHEEWQDAPAQLRASHWLIKTPAGWMAIPKPFELALPGTIGERLVQYWTTNDPRTLENIKDDIFSTLLPPDIMDNPVIKAASALTTGVDSFSGRPIVPDYLKGFEPWLQYTSTTSFMARDIGEATGLSPLYVDNMITGFLSSWGRDVTSLYDYATGRRTSQGFDDAVFTRRFIKDLSRGNTASQIFWDKIGDRTGQLVQAERTYELMATGQASGDAADYLAKQTPETRAYIALKQDAFDADDRRMHPLIRAQGLIGVIGLARREMSADRQKSAATGEPILMTPDQRRMMDDVMAKIAWGEARNALVVAGDPTYRDRKIIDLSGDYETLQTISPEMFDEFAGRLATAKIADFDAVAAVWPEAQARLVQDGTQARLGDLRAQIRVAGFEGGGRKRRIRAEKIEVPPLEAVQ